MIDRSSNQGRHPIFSFLRRAGDSSAIVELGGWTRYRLGCRPKHSFKCEACWHGTLPELGR